MYKIGEKINFDINRQESNFDRACESANHMACARFGVDECGHLNNIEGAERCNSSVVVEFVSYQANGGMGGWTYNYHFQAWVEKNEE